MPHNGKKLILVQVLFTVEEYKKLRNGAAMLPSRTVAGRIRDTLLMRDEPVGLKSNPDIVTESEWIHRFDI